MITAIITDNELLATIQLDKYLEDNYPEILQYINSHLIHN